MRAGMFVSVFLLFTCLNAWAYDAIDVKDGGTLKGTVQVTGNIPQDETVTVTKDKSYCGDTLPREKYVISPEGQVKNVVVMLVDVAKGKAMPKDVVEIDNKKCAFHPHVQVGTIKQKVGIKNNDPMLHNTHVYLNKRTILNVALPLTGFEVKKKVRRDGLMEVHCDVHSFMLGYLYIAEHPYITVTDDKGAYSLKDIPPGEYTVLFWHEAFREMKKNVTIGPAAATTLDVQYEAK